MTRLWRWLRVVRDWAWWKEHHEDLHTEEANRWERFEQTTDKTFEAHKRRMHLLQQQIFHLQNTLRWHEKKIDWLEGRATEKRTVITMNGQTHVITERRTDGQ